MTSGGESPPAAKATEESMKTAKAAAKAVRFIRSLFWARTAVSARGPNSKLLEPAA
jgi:hypothetical protein